MNAWYVHVREYHKDKPAVYVMLHPCYVTGVFGRATHIKLPSGKRETVPSDCVIPSGDLESALMRIAPETVVIPELVKGGES